MALSRLHRLPSAFTRFARLLALPERVAGLFRPCRPEPRPTCLRLEAMEDRLVPANQVIVSSVQPGGESGSFGSAVINLQRSGDLSAALSIPYTLGGTATGGGVDYTPSAAAFNFVAGSANAQVTFAVVNDSTPELDESIAVTMPASVGGFTVLDTQTGTQIFDDDRLQTVSVSASAVLMAEGGLGATFTITRSNNLTGVTPTWQFSAVTVNFTLGGTATVGSDYTASATTSVTIPAFQTSATVTITPLNDSLVEGGETVVLNIEPNSAYTVGGAPLAVPGTFPRATVALSDPDFRAGATAPLASNPADASDCFKLLIQAAAGDGPRARTVSGWPVRYADGSVQLIRTDLASSGPLGDWGQTRSWSNGAGYADGQAVGSGWVVSQGPRLTQVSGTATLAVVTDALTAWYFDQQGGGGYLARFGGTEKLTYNSGTDTYSLTTGTGDVLVFAGFSPSRPPARRGQFESFTTAGGVAAAVVAWAADGRIAEVRASAGGVTESYLYAYLSSGVNAGLLASVTHRRSADGGTTWSTIGSVEYAYYNGVEAHGNAGDLKTATVKDANGDPISIDYYRYYTAGESGGYQHGLKYALLGASYDRLRAALGGTDAAVFAASDGAVAPYADHYFEYDSAGRVSLEVASGAGCSACSGGQGTFGFSYTASANAAGHNSWAVKTVEALPDGNTNTVYTNAYGAVMLKAYTDAATSQTWLTYYEYDAEGRVVLVADPSAVSGYSDSYADLVHFVSGNAQYLRDTDGLLMAYVYGSSTTATTSTAGNVTGFLKETDLLHGETGTLLNGRLVPQQSQNYIARAAGGANFYFVASTTVYRNDDGTGGQTASYAYTWHGSTAAVESMAVTLPVVTTAQNGSNAATSVDVVCDSFGRPIWQKDQAGFLTYMQYDPATGALVKIIQDVDDSQTGTFSGLPGTWSTPGGGGLHLTTTYEVDELGRTTKTTYPNGRVDYTVYDDVNHEIRVYAGWNSSTHKPTGPTTVYREDRANGYTEMITMSAAPALNGSNLPTGGEAISAIQSLSRSYRNEAGQVIQTDVYFNLSGLTYSTSTSLGTQNVNFYRTSYQYDNHGLLNKTVSPEGTIYRTVYDGLGRVISEWVGTDDTPSTGFWSPTNLTGTNTVKVREYQYDDGGVGDSNLTKVTEFPGGGATARVTQMWYDWRDRVVAAKSGVEVSEGTDVNRPLVVYTYDNLNEVTQTQQYDGDGVTPSISSGVLSLPGGTSAKLRAQAVTSFDNLGRVYRRDVYSVDPSNGSVGAYTLHSDTWYDARGLAIKTADPGGLVEKTTYDGAGRVVTTYATDGGGDSGYSDTDDVTGDTVLEQVEYAYDASGNVLSTKTRERFHNASGTGALGNPSSGVGARVSYMGYYYDLADRLVASVDVGTNGGSSWTRPGSVPGSSATVHMTADNYAADAVQDVTLTGTPTGGTFTLSFGGFTTGAIAHNASASTVQSALEALASIGSGNVVVSIAVGGWEVRFTGTLAGKYQVAITGNGSGLTGGTSPGVSVATVSYGSDAGQVAEVTDPAGRKHRTYYDALGRTVRTVENFVDGVVSDTDDKTTAYTYNGVGMTSLSAYLTSVGVQRVQTTQWVYGVSGTLASNDIVGATRWPDPTTGTPTSGQQESVTVNALGETVTSTDRNGSVHTLTYDVLGRVVSDAVTTLGSGVDGAVRRIEYAYDGQGNASLITSYDAASGGSIVNQVQRVFNGLGQLITEYQEHGGAVNTSTSPKVQYAYSEMASGANHSRPTSVTYPGGYVLTYNYSSGLNDSISRLSSLSDSTGTLEAYSYLGLDTVVVRSHPQPGLTLTYVGTPSDAGDQYAGLDRFGRVADQRWEDTGVISGVADDFQYGYDLLGNRIYRDNLVSGAFGELYSYDGMNQLVSFDRGTLDGTKTGLTGSGPSRSQDWDYDAVGNFDSVTTDGSTQTRSANAQNEITGISGATTPTYDANGNMTGDETGRTFIYDAWNRLVAVKSGSTVLKTYSYDGLNRRVTEAAGGSTTDLLYSKDWQVLEEKVGSNATKRYVWSPVYVDAMVLRDRDTDANGSLDERLWVIQDANFNVTALVDNAGAVVERYVYDPFGKVTVLDANWSPDGDGNSDVAWAYLHQGGRLDGVSGLYHFRNRDYSATLGRWVSPDPIRFLAGDVNLYRVVRNNPTNSTDPTGLQPPSTIRQLPVIPSDRLANPIPVMNRYWGRGGCTSNPGEAMRLNRIQLANMGYESLQHFGADIRGFIVHAADQYHEYMVADFVTANVSYSGGVTYGFSVTIDKNGNIYYSPTTGYGVGGPGGGVGPGYYITYPHLNPQQLRDNISGPGNEVSVGLPVRYPVGFFYGESQSTHNMYFGPQITTPGVSQTQYNTQYLGNPWYWLGDQVWPRRANEPEIILDP